MLVQYAGQDATTAYNEVHSPGVIVKSLSPAYLIGKLDPSSIDDDWKDNKSTQLSQPQANKPPLNAILSSHDFEDAARSTLSKKAWAYYSSAATDTISHRANQSFFNRIWFRPRLLRNVSTVSTRRTVLGTSCELPVIVAPVALARLANSIGEKGIAAAVAKKGIRYCVRRTRTPRHPHLFSKDIFNNQLDSNHGLLPRRGDHCLGPQLRILLPAVRQ